MKNLVWTTDCHLNFISEIQIKQFCNKIAQKNPDAVVITGDISEATTLEIHMRMMEMYLGPTIPIYFVCGNHDYYHGSITDIRNMLKLKFNQNSATKWLANFDFISLTDKVALVGHDGWYDGRYADYFQSSLDMPDYYLIHELKGGIYYKQQRFDRIGQLAIEGALHVQEGIKKAFETHDQVFVATHVAPFKENSRAPDGKMSDRHWMPHFSSKIMGDMLLNVAKEYPLKQLVVLCGHNHTFWRQNYAPNLVCITGGAEYNKPCVTDVFQI